MKLSHEERAKRRKRMAADAKRTPVSEVAKKWKVSEQTVVAACREHGVPVPSAGAKVSRAQQADRRKRMAAEAKRCDIETVAAKYGVSLATVQAACREHGIKIPRKQMELGQTLVVIRMLVDGEKPSAIVEKLGVTRQLVSHAKKKAIEAGFRL